MTGMHQVTVSKHKNMRVMPERLERETLVMDCDALLRWKQQIFNYQHRVRESSPPQQATLFDLAPVHCDPEKIDPKVDYETRRIVFTLLDLFMLNES
jgi:hypothetical protein